MRANRPPGGGSQPKKAEKGTETQDVRRSQASERHKKSDAGAKSSQREGLVNKKREHLKSNRSTQAKREREKKGV